MASSPLDRKSRHGVVPGLDPTAPYTSRLSARSALYADLRILLEQRPFPLPSSAYRMLVVDQNCLGRRSTKARKKIWGELKARYRLDAQDPLFGAFWTEWQRCESEAERALTAYVLLALNDRLVMELGTDWLFPLLRKAPAYLSQYDLHAFLRAISSRRPEVEGWSEETRMAVVRKYCTSLRDFGLARGTIFKTTQRPALYGAPVRVLVRALRLVGTSELQVIQAPVFRLLGIETTEVIDALGELNRTGALRFRIQADVVELDLPGGD